MRKSIAILTSLAFALCATAPVNAQSSQTGSRFKSDRMTGSEDRARLALDFFGKCVARLKDDDFVAYMNEPSGENWAAVTYFPNSQTRCAAHGDMVFSPRTAQGVIAEGWYLMKYPDGLSPQIAALEPHLPPQGPAIKAIMAASEEAKPFVVVDEFARCVVASSPQKSDAFLRTKVTSKEEREALGALSPHLAPCAFDGQELSFTLMGLRGAIAFSLAELALNPTMHQEKSAD